MQKTLIALAFALSATTAMAADAVYNEPPATPSVVAPVFFSWSGPYAGIQGGAGWSKARFANGANESSFKLNGGLVGGFIGYQSQLDNNLVVGIEGDLDYNWNEKKISAGPATLKYGTDLAGSVRARLGYAYDRTLVYATGGWATTRGYADLEAAGLSVKQRETFNGWTVGAGVEQAFTDNLFGRLEYRYNDYGKKTFEDVTTRLDQHSVKVGLGVKF